MISLTFTPKTENVAAFYEFSGIEALEPILAGVLPPCEAMVPPGGYSKGWNTALSFSIAGVALAA